MERNNCLGTLRTALLIVVATLAWAGRAAASTYTVIHDFKWPKNPQGNLTLDAAGNLYGTTYDGGGTGCGGSGCGVVWKLKPNPSGTWTVSILHVFNGADGANPAAGLVFDTAGNLYGTTYFGGIAGSGIVFKLAPNSDGTWTESVLIDFFNDDAAGPSAGLVFDAAGNLYGTTFYGGIADWGVVFKLAPNPDGTWTESVLYSFLGSSDGGNPQAGLVFDAAGNLYGTATFGGADGPGVVFKLAPNPDGTWRESVLHSFTGGADGNSPQGGLVFDATGNLYGTTYLGGAHFNGVVFKLVPHSDGTWTESVLHSFAGVDGSGPSTGLVFDTAGNLYGTTSHGGVGYGVVFKLKPTSSGWRETVLHTFIGVGKFPKAPVILDPAGNLYGTTSDGNHSFDYGRVFGIKP